MGCILSYNKWTKKQIYEAYSLEHHAHKQTQVMFNQEVKAHALTRAKLLNKTLFSTSCVLEIDDSWLPFIFDNMKKYGSEYNDYDFSLYKKLKHFNIGGFKDGKIRAFGCVVVVNDIYAMSYSWNDGTLTGKKLYIKGIDYINSRFNGIIYEENGSRLNKIKRM